MKCLEINNGYCIGVEMIVFRYYSYNLLFGIPFQNVFAITVNNLVLKEEQKLRSS